MAERIPQRIMVYGVTGSGKSTLAAAIGRVTGLPYHSIDDYTWEPGWKPVSDDRQREIIAALVSEDSWVIDSGYAKWLDLVLPRVELIVGLDYPPALVFARLLRRTLRRVITRELSCNGNREQFLMAFGKDSILRWFFKSYKRKRARIREWSGELSCQVICFAWPREATKWLKKLRSADLRR